MIPLDSNLFKIGGRKITSQIILIIIVATSCSCLFSPNFLGVLHIFRFSSFFIPPWIMTTEKTKCKRVKKNNQTTKTLCSHPIYISTRTHPHSCICMIMYVCVPHIKTVFTHVSPSKSPYQPNDLCYRGLCGWCLYVLWCQPGWTQQLATDRYRSIHPAVYPSIHLFIHLSICLTYNIGYVIWLISIHTHTYIYTYTYVHTYCARLEIFVNDQHRSDHGWLAAGNCEPADLCPGSVDRIPHGPILVIRKGQIDRTVTWIFTLWGNHHRQKPSWKSSLSMTLWGSMTHAISDGKSRF